MNTSTASRIYYEPELKRFADEHIELPYTQIKYGTLSNADRKALPTLIDPYGEMLIGSRYAMSIRVPLSRRLQAAGWASQFGVLVFRRDGEEILANVVGHHAVRANNYHDASLLAGIQVMREHSIRCLTADGGSVN